MNFSNLHILVLGDVFLDEYQFGECTRISPEAPVPIIQIEPARTKDMPGGAGNVAANIRSLGASCSLGAKMGLDTAGNRLNDLLLKQGIFPIFAYPKKYNTPVKTRIVAQNQQVVRLDRERNDYIDQIELSKVLASIPYCDALILSDYAKGYFSRKNVEQIITTANALGKPVIVDTKPENVEWFEGATWFTPNLKEYTAMKGRIPSDKVLVTKGAQGIKVYDGSWTYDIPAVQREVVDVAGAGDTVIAAFTLALAAKMEVKEAAEFANKAAGVVVGKQGTSTVTLEEVEAFKTDLHGFRVKDAA
jgi:rfaE bifunctional protein kinase chain/domain